MKLTGWLAAGLLFLVGALGPASAQEAPQAWTGPDTSRRVFLIGHEVENFDLGIANVCFPYLFQNADEASFRTTTGVVPRSGEVASMPGAHAYWVGRYVTAGVRTKPDGRRDCSLYAERGDPEALRTATLARLAAAPASLRPALSPMRATTYTHRDLLCGPADAATPTYALVDTGPRTNGERGPAIIISIWTGGERDRRCDTIAQAPAPEDTGALQARFGAALDGCRLVIAGVSGDPSFQAEGIQLSAPARLGDTPLSRRRDNGIVDFFGLDARIRLAIPLDRGALIMVITAEADRKCEASAASHTDLAASVLPTLQSHEADWTQIDAQTLGRPNGARARVLTSANADGATLVRVFMSGGS